MTIGQKLVEIAYVGVTSIVRFRLNYQHLVRIFAAERLVNGKETFVGNQLAVAYAKSG